MVVYILQWYNLSIDKVLQELKSNEKTGLTSAQVIERQAKSGKNKLAEKKKKSFISKFFAQFADFLILILLVAALISAITAYVEKTSDYIDSIIILAIVVMNAIIGVVQESKAEKAIDALKKLSAPKARVRRNGKEIKIDSEELVPGDIIILEAGDFVPADARILSCSNLSSEESSLTGESVPSEKNSEKINRENTPLGDRNNMLFSSCSISTGNAVCVVTDTGMNTQVGHIANMINDEDSPQTPLQKRLAQTGKYLGIAAMVICVVIFALGILQGKGFLEMFMTSVSLAVAAIPESLPAVVTIVLAVGVRKLAANRAIIRNLPAVETLGSANVICSDKTGTLTQNKMTVTELRNQSGVVYEKSDAAREILRYATLCNNASLNKQGEKVESLGDPTETALVIAAYKNNEDKLLLEEQYKRVYELPFDSDRKLMTTVHALANGKYRVITKGAPDVLLSLCSGYIENSEYKELTASVKNKITAENKEMAEKALRVLAVSYKDIDSCPSNDKGLEESLTFVGLVGMIDPPRPEAKAAVKECLRAGIKPVMITGDHILTAKAIARELLILGDKEKAITGEELENISQSELEKDIFKYSVFARVSPEHKVRIVKAFQSHGAVVSMTGDGVNDAPALKASDIGCAMGITGTDVAKSAADMIMTDDNFATIVKAVHEGRGIFDNIKKTVRFLVSCNVGEILLILIASIFGMPIPLLAIQLLWVNLVTDSLPALALGSEPAEANIMDRKPLKRSEGLFSGGVGYNMLIEGLFIGSISLLAFVIGARFFDINLAYEPMIGRTMAFAVLSISELIHVFDVRSEQSIFKTSLLSNKKLLLSVFICLILEVSVITIPALASIFKCVCLNFEQWMIVAILSISPMFISEIEKFFAHRQKR